jgi:hypothetical protein
MLQEFTDTATDFTNTGDFCDEITPIFTKIGCNDGGCHGKLRGQDGLRLEKAR